ncbi:hypothetical protein [Rhizobium rhizosphaerae]|uniref:hypothetical protein n=1 Tax=Xaviernesmea rhizosphaerae TaxID=1672749 RepID=UPI001300E082|nr:hypothetical protein [Xaviernesmea rhizosphaerae]
MAAIISSELTVSHIERIKALGVSGSAGGLLSQRGERMQIGADEVGLRQSLRGHLA